MKYLDNTIDLGAESGEDAVASTLVLTTRLYALEERLRKLPSNTDAVTRAELEKQAALLLLGLDRENEAWARARPAFEIFVGAEKWEQAVEVCDILYRTGQAGSLPALGQGVWLAVTFPINPELSVAMLQHIVDETPDDSDGAAVAAAAAKYIVDLRAQGKQHEDLDFFAMQLLSAVARRHSGVEGQDQFANWMHRLELDDPAKFLVRLRNVIDVIVQDDWWFDRESLQSRLPVN